MENEPGNDIEVFDWYGLYGSAANWGKILNPEAYQHPAKISPALARKIYGLAIERGMIQPGDIVLDPFSGIGGFAYHALLAGLCFVGVELERHFVDMGQGCDCAGISAADWRRWQGRWAVGGRGETNHWCPRCLEQARAAPSYQGRPIPRPQQAAIRARRDRILFLRGKIMKDKRPARMVRAGNTVEQCLDHRSGGQAGLVTSIVASDRPRRELLTRPLPFFWRPLLPGNGLLIQSELNGALPKLPSLVYRGDGQMPFSLPHHYEGNIQRWERELGRPGQAVLVQGDSRRLLAVLSENPEATAVLSSPSWQDSLNDGAKHAEGQLAHLPPAQMSSMAEGAVSLVASSPAYSPHALGHRGTGNDIDEARRLHARLNDNRYGAAAGQMSSMAEGEVSLVASSPPYADAINTSQSGILFELGQKDYPGRVFHEGRVVMNRRHHDNRQYGEEAGQMGAMRNQGDVDVVVSSSPYATSVNQAAGANDNQARRDRQAAAGVDTTKVQARGGPNSVLNRPQVYGAEEGQLGAMTEGMVDLVASSSPYANGAQHIGGRDPAPQHIEGGPLTYVDYGASAGQLGNMAAVTLLSSPPYADSVNGGEGPGARHDWVSHSLAQAMKLSSLSTYGLNEAQLGNAVANTFWGAARLVMEQCWLALRPGGWAIWVCGPYVRDKKIVDFPDQWRRLGQACGFQTKIVARAWKKEDKGNAVGLLDIDGTIQRGKKARLDGGKVRQATVSNVSFFRRLTNEKNPEAAVELEVVLFMQKPIGNDNE